MSLLSCLTQLTLVLPCQWATVHQAVGQLVREFESGVHDKLVENATADVREAIRLVLFVMSSSCHLRCKDPNSLCETGQEWFPCRRLDR